MSDSGESHSWKLFLDEPSLNDTVKSWIESCPTPALPEPAADIGWIITADNNCHDCSSRDSSPDRSHGSRCTSHATVAGLASFVTVRIAVANKMNRTFNTLSTHSGSGSSLNSSLSTHSSSDSISTGSSLSTIKSSTCVLNATSSEICKGLTVTDAESHLATTEFYENPAFCNFKFSPPVGTDTVKTNGINSTVKTKMQAITAMDECRGFSFEELRLGYKQSCADKLDQQQKFQPSNQNSKDSDAPPESDPKRRKTYNFPTPVDVLVKDCCVDRCLQHLSLIDIESCQIHMKDKREEEQLNYILHQVSSHTLLRRKGQSFNFVIGGKSVCEDAWCKAHNVTKWRFRKCVKGYRKGIRRFNHGNRGRRKMTAKTANALGWMRHYFERIGDYMPHKTEVHLPSTWTKGSVYKKMRADFKDRGFLPKDIVSPSYFTTLWLQHLPEFVISKQREFTVCSTCAELTERGCKAKSSLENAEIKSLKTQHDEQVSKERAAYHCVRERAQREPTQYTVMIVDGMDQSKTDVPRVVKDKELAPLNKLKTHLTGVLLHTDAPEGKIPYIYIDVKQIPHDSNMTINTILDVLILNKEKLGRILFLQLDNCYRENKNRYLLSFASLLVEMGVFEEVIVHFLPVGHTHEDVDKMFSCISKEMSNWDSIFTLEDLKIVIEQSFTPMIQVKQATPQYNVKEWIEPHMAGRFQNHSQPHWFRFRKSKDGDDDVLMHYKMWVDDGWLPKPEYGPDNQAVIDASSLGLKCLKTIPDVQVSPEWVIPSLDKLDVDGLLKDLPHGYVNRMPEDRQQWWHQYMSNLESLTEVPPEPTTWPLEKLIHRISATCPVWELDQGLLRLKSKVGAECARIRIGKQGTINYRQAENVNSYESLKLGDLTLINLDGFPAEQQPYIGKVLDVRESTVEIQWMEGKYTRDWKESFTGVGRNRSKVIDEIPKQSILLFGFQLTRKGRLRAETVKQMKELYLGLD